MRTTSQNVSEFIASTFNVHPRPKGPTMPETTATHTDPLTEAAPDLLAALERVAHIPCERQGNIHCTMLPPDSGLELCPWCSVRAAIAKAKGEDPR